MQREAACLSPLPWSWWSLSPSPGPRLQGCVTVCTARRRRGADAGWWGFLAHPRLSLVLRPWIQDIEGVNAKNVCSPSKARASVPKGKVPHQKVVERQGPSLPGRLLQPLMGVNAFPHLLIPLAPEAVSWQVRPTVPKVPKLPLQQRGAQPGGG